MMKVKKAFLRFVSGLMVVCMAILLSGGAVAVGEGNKSLTFKEIKVSDDVAKEKVQLIVNAINGEEAIMPRGNILCIFGHSKSRGTTWVTTHGAYSTSPKCKQETYDTIYCTRSGCDYIDVTLISISRIFCCP